MRLVDSRSRPDLGPANVLWTHLLTIFSLVQTDRKTTAGSLFEALCRHSEKDCHFDNSFIISFRRKIEKHVDDMGDIGVGRSNLMFILVIKPVAGQGKMA